MINVIVKTSLRIWVQFQRYFASPSYSTHAPLASNHIFPPSLADCAFLRCSSLGIKTFKHFIDIVFAFQHRSDKFHFSGNCLWFIYSLVHNAFPMFPNLPKDSILIPGCGGCVEGHQHCVCCGGVGDMLWYWLPVYIYGYSSPIIWLIVCLLCFIIILLSYLLYLYIMGIKLFWSYSWKVMWKNVWS